MAQTIDRTTLILAWLLAALLAGAPALASAAEEGTSSEAEPLLLAQADTDALAEEDEEDGAGAFGMEGDVTRLEEIVITAEKREENLQRTPVSVTAFTQTDINQLQIRNPLNLLEYTPNVYFAKDSRGTGFLVTSRGIGTGDTGQIGADPATGIYIDGVYSGITIGSLFDVLSLERVEVLRGPQGTLYGRNTTGGAINFISRKPSGQWGAEMQARGGSYYRGDFNGYIEAPLWGGEGIQLPDSLGTASIGASIATINRGALFRNDFQLPIEEERRIAGRVTGYWEKDSDLGETSLFVAWDGHSLDESSAEQQLTEVFRDDSIPIALDQGALLNGRVFEASFGTVGTDQREFATYGRNPHLDIFAPERDKLFVQGVGLTFQHGFEDLPALGDLTPKLVFGYRSVDAQQSSDRDGSRNYVFENTSDTFKQQLTVDFNFIGTTLDDRLEYVLGYYYFQENGDEVQTQMALEDPQFDNVFVPFVGVADIGQTQTSYPEIDNHANAIYANVGFTLPIVEDRFKVSGGVRYTNERRAFTSRIDVLLPANNPVNGVAGEIETLPETSDGKTFEDVTGSAKLSFQALDELFTYFSYSRGFKSGGFNTRAATPALLMSPFDSETVDAYELGFKWQFWDQRVRLNADGFYLDYTNLQRTILTLEPTGLVASTVLNAADAEVWGSEIELLATPLDRLWLNVGYGLTLGSFKSFEECTALGPGATLPSDCTTFTGVPGATYDYADQRKFANAPEHSVNVGAQYSLPAFSWGVVTARLDYYWQSMTWLQNGDEPRASMPAFGLLNGRIAFEEIEVGGSKMTFGIWGRNLLDRQYKDFGIDFNTNTNANVIGASGEPTRSGVGQFPWIVQHFGNRRLIGIDLRIDFGA